jgi:hypothetical protein
MAGFRLLQIIPGSIIPAKRRHPWANPPRGFVSA